VGRLFCTFGESLAVLTSPLCLCWANFLSAALSFFTIRYESGINVLIQDTYFPKYETIPENLDYISFFVQKPQKQHTTYESQARRSYVTQHISFALKHFAKNRLCSLTQPCVPGKVTPKTISSIISLNANTLKHFKICLCDFALVATFSFFRMNFESWICEWNWGKVMIPRGGIGSAKTAMWFSCGEKCLRTNQNAK